MPIGVMAWAMLAFAVAGLVKGISGIGYSTTALPILTLGVGIETAMPLVLLPSIASNLMVMVTAGHFRSSLSRFWPLYVAMLPGLILGLSTLSRVDKSIAEVALGAVILGYTAYALARPETMLPAHLHKLFMVPAGFLNGLVNGLTGSQIMPMIPYMMSLKLQPNEFVQSTNIGFTLASLVMLAGLTSIGYLDWSIVFISLAGLVPAFACVKVGTAVRSRLQAHAFRIIVLMVLAVLAISLLARHISLM